MLLVSSAKRLMDQHELKVHGIGQFSVLLAPPAGACLRSLRARGKPYMLCTSSKTRSSVSRFNSDAEIEKRKIPFHGAPS